MTAKILVTGGTGQIGLELVVWLRERYGCENVVCSDIKTEGPGWLYKSGSFERVDVTNKEGIGEVVEKYDINTIYHMAAILSAKGEKDPRLTWDVNMSGLYNILEISRKHNIRVFWPSSIAVFGSETPNENTPQRTILSPITIYGITKVAGEHLCNYYSRHFGLDVRGIRYPGVIGGLTSSGGGTTDYAVEMFYKAVKHEKCVCFVREDTVLPFIYMPDCIRGTISLMETDPSKLKCRVGYNLSGVSFSAGELVAEIERHVPTFKCEYRPDSRRQEIADSWPRSIEDTVAREEWGWKPSYDLSSMTKDMVEKLSKRYA